MSEPVAEDLKQESHSPSQKRKRGGDSPSERRTKRNTAVAPAANMSGGEPLNHAFLENAAAQATANVDLSALQQANEAANQTDAADATSASTTAAAALGSMYPTMQVPTTTEQQFADSASANQDSSQDASFAEVSPVTQPEGAGTPAANVTSGSMVGTNGTPQPSQVQQSARRDYQFRKPAVGTEEWHKLRKDNHKEVERRRRETINEGINELAKIVPNCEKNKGSILQKAVQYIQQMKANESSNIEKWTLEKLLTEQAIAELTAANEKLKVDYDQVHQELEQREQEMEQLREKVKKFASREEAYKKMLTEHGLELDVSEADGNDS